MDEVKRNTRVALKKNVGNTAQFGGYADEQKPERAPGIQARPGRRLRGRVRGRGRARGGARATPVAGASRTAPPGPRCPGPSWCPGGAPERRRLRCGSPGGGSRAKPVRPSQRCPGASPRSRRGGSAEERPRPGGGGGRAAPRVQGGKAGVQSLVCHQPRAAGAASCSTFVCLSFQHLSRNCWAG